MCCLMSCATLGLVFSIESVSESIEFLDIQEFSGSKHKRITTFHMFQDQTSQVRECVALLVEMSSTWGVEIFAPHILFMFRKSKSIRSACQTNIFAPGVCLAFFFLALPVIHTVLSLTSHWIPDLMGVSSDLPNHRSCAAAFFFSRQNEVSVHSELFQISSKCRYYQILGPQSL